ncbi:hypothetical protein H0H93_009421 [Arthromyces matolae]|nr:hypothetical protein H0H93_009421 [Arthromyces matolae]
MVKTRRAHRLASEIERNDEPAPKRIKLPDAEASGKTKFNRDFLEFAPYEYSVPSRSRKSQKIQPNIDINSFPKRHISPWKVGAHVSVAGGVENAILNAAEIGANAFALFLKSQRKWTSPPLTKESIDAFKERMETFGYSSSVVLPHGSYLINLGNPDPAKRKQSFECFLDDLQRCEQLGLTLYNFHPGSTVGATTIEESIRLVAECINKAHSQTTSVITVIENMAGAGNVIGHDFAHLGGIISQVEDKSRVGVCIDTCHMFSAGYDIRKKEDWEFVTIYTIMLQ